jgi:hypothetical protein
MSNLLFKDGEQHRDPTLKATDKSALNAVVQACVNVELFTIPLYMTSLYSIYGLHQITGQNDFYQGRNWPGMATVADPKTPNDTAFNAIFSVFIAEMLHLQLASNICKAVGVSPTYTSPALMNSNYGWTCYGPKNTILPHILDFKDAVAPHDKIKVKLGPVNKEQLELFLAIEETEADAEKLIKEDKRSKYFPKVPFKGWKEENTEADLPMFGSIGWMYLCLWEYLSIQYSDGTTLWQYVHVSDPLQQDLFNVNNSDHKPEYPGMPATVTSNLLGSDELIRIRDMINGITDQGEGGGVIKMINARLKLPPQAVKPNFQPNKENLEADYPAYTDTGKSAPSRDAAARAHWGSKDHFETFQDVKAILDKITTWEHWHADPKNKWTADMLKSAGYEENIKKYPHVPKAEDIAGALNRLKENNKGDSNYTLFSQASAGAIAGVTTVLNDYWNTPGATFPYPSMAGSGDRMAICWAIFGKAPDLSMGIKAKQKGVLYHACQGLSLDPSSKSDPNVCAAVEVYHTCKGSNTCKTEGGCGFVAGGGCGSRAAALRSTSSIAYRQHHANPEMNKVEGTCAPIYVSAPSDNKCITLGGCAVPMSASQIFPAPKNKMTIMNLFDFGPAPDYSSELFARMGYGEGDMVYAKAWEAYTKVLENRKQPIPPNPPKPSDIRLALPPST